MDRLVWLVGAALILACGPFVAGAALLAVALAAAKWLLAPGRVRIRIEEVE